MKIAIILNGKYKNDVEMEARKKYYEAKASKGTEIEFLFPSEECHPFPPSPFWLTNIGVEIVKKAKEAETLKYDAVVVYNPYDPGVDTAMSMVKIPVIGSGRTAFHVAAMLGDKICVIGCESSWIPLSYRLARTLGFDGMITRPIRALDIPVEEMKNSKKEAKERFIKLAKMGIAEGGQVIFPQGLNCLSVHLPLKELESEIGCPVVDAVPLAIRTAETFVELGLKQSAIAYPYHDHF